MRMKKSTSCKITITYKYTGSKKKHFIFSGTLIDVFYQQFNANVIRTLEFSLRLYNFRTNAY